MTKSEKDKSIRDFIQKWNNRGQEDQDDQSFWFDLFQMVLEVQDVTSIIQFQKRVDVNGKTKKIDAYLPDTKVIIEQKSKEKKLDEKILQGDGELLTPYEQALRYNNSLISDEKVRWIVTSNFNEIWIYDLNIRERDREPIRIFVDELQTKYKLLEFLKKDDVKEVINEVDVSVQAGDIVGLIYDAFLEEYGENPTEDDLRELNKLCVRIVFCLYAEDAGLFEVNAFHDYLNKWNVENMNTAMEELFNVLDTPVNERKRFLKEDLARFPYVNGSLFRGSVEIPPITEKIKDLLINQASMGFDWSQISPTIFGAVFESTLNPETRRAGGMHYTSIENIHKVIDPLFLDDLKKEFSQIVKVTVPRSRKIKLQKYQEKLASLKFLDPACGSGNFLTETFLSLRRLENQVLAEIDKCDKNAFEGQIGFGDYINPIKVSIQQFYGIEINDFAVTVAKTAMWIAENQMMQETADLLFMDLDFLPLKSYVNIAEGNALRMDWNEVIPSNECNYIMGNPPFIGYKFQTVEQKKDIKHIAFELKNYGTLDYVSGWYLKAKNYILNTKIVVAFVSTNSISQGEHVTTLWRPLLETVEILFAHRTFIWDSEANLKAHVHCVIVGFACKNVKIQKKRLWYEDGTMREVKQINGYLLDAPDIFIDKRSKPWLDETPIATKGNAAMDNGYLLLNKEEKERILSLEPELEVVIKRHMSADDFLNNKENYCIWLDKISPDVYSKSRFIKERLELVKDYRMKSNRKATNKMAKYPYLFAEIRQPEKDYLMLPVVSSEKRNYIPIAYLSANVINSYASISVPNATLYHFGVLSSNVHMAWMRNVAGRLKSDYRYATSLVYNNFPWPTPTEEQKVKIEQTAQGILDARALYPDASLAKLYDPDRTPRELLKAHQENDIAVMKAYGMDIKTTTAESCVATLMSMYASQKDNKN